jgi:aminoglycoside phosphotransferase (APT) family kinase protein
MDFVEGHILRTTEDVEAIAPSSRKEIARNMSEVLVMLHDLDPDSVGLADFGRREGYLERQIRRWSEQYEKTQTGDSISTALVDEVSHRLLYRLPTQERTAIVHGDYRIDNIILEGDASVKAVLDWELCTLGDPLADLGLLMVYWTQPGEAHPLVENSATAAQGMSSRDEVLKYYTSASTLDLTDLDYYVAFSRWKLACILQGVYARYKAGAGAGDQSNVVDYPSRVRHLLEAGLGLLT